MTARSVAGENAASIFPLCPVGTVLIFNCCRCRCSDILRCVFDTYSGHTDDLGVDRWLHMLQEVGVVGRSSKLVKYQSDGADVTATPLNEHDATEIFEHFSASGHADDDSALVLRLDDESFADALDAVAQRRYSLAADQLGDGSGVAFEWLLRELEEHVVAMQPI